MTNETVSTLNELIETLKDGKDGFQTAAADVKDAKVKAIFLEFSQQRSSLAGELQAEVRRLPSIEAGSTSRAHWAAARRPRWWSRR